MNKHTFYPLVHTLLIAVASGGSTHSVGMTHGNMVPNFAARLIHPGACFPVNRLQRSSEKWLQFLYSGLTCVCCRIYSHLPRQQLVRCAYILL